jgi:spermidine/putrescine transport system permease protein
MTRRARIFSWIAIGLILLFLFAPVVLVVLFSFNSVASTAPPLKGLSLRWYEELFANPEFTFALKNSLEAAGATICFVLLTGTAAAIALSRRRSRLLDALSALVVAPLVIPGLFLGVALFAFFNKVGIELSLFTIVIGQSLVTIPLVVLVVNARLANTDTAMLEAARDLGANGFQTFRKVLLPLIAPTLGGAALLVAAWSLDEVIVTLWTNGGDTTLPVMIFGLVRKGTDPSVNAIASLVLAGTTCVTILASRFISPSDLTG